MSKNLIPTRIQSRLNRKNIKVSLGEIKDELSRIAIDADNPTDDEIDAVVEHFLDQFSKPVIQDEFEIEAMSMTNYANAPTKSELVASTAQSLGIVLNTQEIADIANNINYSSDDLHDSLDEIKSAIVAFIKYKASLNSQKISQIVSDINQIATEEFNHNSQQLTEGLQSVNRQMQQQNTDFKSRVKSAIAAFALPPGR